MMPLLTRGAVAAVRRRRGVVSATTPTSSTATASTAMAAFARVVAVVAVLPTATRADANQQQAGNDDLFAEGSGNMIIGVLVVIGLLLCGAGAYMWWYRYRGPNSDHAQAKAMAAYSFNPNAPGANDAAAVYAGYPQQYYVPGPGNATPTPLGGVTVDGAGDGAGAGAGAANGGPPMMPPPGYQFVMGPNGPMLAPMGMAMGMPMPMPMMMPNADATPGAAGTAPQQAVAGGATPATGAATATPGDDDVRPASPGDETDDEDFAAELRAINDADDVEDILTASRRLQLSKSQRQAAASNSFSSAANASTRGGTSASQAAAPKPQPATSTHVSSTSMAPSTASGSSRMGSPSGVPPSSNATPATRNEESVPGDGLPAAAAVAAASSRRQSHLSLSSIASDVDGGAVDSGDSAPGAAAAASAPPTRPSAASSTRTVDKIRSASDVNVSRASIISNTQAAIQRAMDGDGEFDDESLGSVDNDFSLLGDDVLELDEP